MKLAIDLLRERRNVLHKGVRDATYNADYYQKEVDKTRANAAYYQKEADKTAKTVQGFCTQRNLLQVQLNEIDSAIEKLEK